MSNKNLILNLSEFFNYFFFSKWSLRVNYKYNELETSFL